MATTVLKYDRSGYLLIWCMQSGGLCGLDFCNRLRPVSKQGDGKAFTNKIPIPQRRSCLLVGVPHREKSCQ